MGRSAGRRSAPSAWPPAAERGGASAGYPIVAAYLFIKTRVDDPERYARYVSAVRELAASWGSRFIVRSRPVELLEGSPDEWGDHLLLVSEWPSVEAARSFWRSEQYRVVRELRVGAGEVHVMLTEELPPPPGPG